jgi:protein transport protein DSL1/ZW10
MDDFQHIIAAVRLFCDKLGSFKFTGFDELLEWVDNIPKVWLSKCRESALDSIRSKLTQGLGDPMEVERIETQTVSKSEGKELAANGITSPGVDDGWDAAWSDGEVEADAKDGMPEQNADDGADAWGWGDDDEQPEQEPEKQKLPASGEVAADNDDDDSADAWGWGDDETNAQPDPAPTPDRTAASNAHSSKTKELTMKETYHISSMPEPVLTLISTILEDGALLVSSVPTPYLHFRRKLITQQKREQSSSLSCPGTLLTPNSHPCHVPSRFTILLFLGYGRQYVSLSRPVRTSSLAKPGQVPI